MYTYGSVPQAGGSEGDSAPSRLTPEVLLAAAKRRDAKPELPTEATIVVGQLDESSATRRHQYHLNDSHCQADENRQPERDPHGKPGSRHPRKA